MTTKDKSNFNKYLIAFDPISKLDDNCDIYKNEHDEFFERISNLTGIPKVDIEEADETRKQQASREVVNAGTQVTNDYNEITQRFLRFFEDRVKQKPPKTVDEKLDEVIFNMREIESLFYALSLGLSDPAERQAFDTVFNNWKNDQLAKRY